MEQLFKAYWTSQEKEVGTTPPKPDQLVEEGTPEWERFKQTLKKAAHKKKRR
ncbi:hypothetical protein JOC54_003698 [Alkalihalobacillus xiaoxiensis]|uniref:Uncharacterized protein n=1 Tax=Shouchella xiaoxiensis TaxID=766895 RepID=A0ABS2T1S2_9BACI|nr:hypothetical protein [Shouchella xiaoxiensis]MBM7840417.1 hypothetical protein [Shouchella xiaoxiensis]